MCGLRRRGYALGGRVSVIQPFLRRVPVLDRAARQAGVEGEPHGLGDAGGIFGKAVLEVSRDGQLARRGKSRGVRERLLAADRVVQSPSVAA